MTTDDIEAIKQAGQIQALHERMTSLMWNAARVCERIPNDMHTFDSDIDKIKSAIRDTELLAREWKSLQPLPPPDAKLTVLGPNKA